jgi:NAD+ diphosphatase
MSGGAWCGPLADTEGATTQRPQELKGDPYCGRCGSRTHTKEKERAKVCLQCGLHNFPRLSPAIIVAVERGEEILLARSAHFPQGMFSVLAGFVEPGETIEECVVREVKEEVGITVGNIRYFGSRPWPFPHSLMLGFTAEYVEGELPQDLVVGLRR